MRKTLLALLSIFAAVPGMAQVSVNITPKTVRHHIEALPSRILEMPRYNYDSLLAEDLQYAHVKNRPYRFGHNHYITIDVINEAEKTVLPEGNLYRLAVKSKGAYSLNFGFDKYILPAGAMLHIYNEDRSHMIGAFTEKNNHADHRLATNLVHGDMAILEYFVPSGSATQGNLRIFRVAHDYRDFDGWAKSYGDAGSCNVNMNCPAGDDWQVEKRAVACIMMGGVEGCTGALVNNTLNDGTPYFLTANHCLDGGEGDWVFRFNWESPGCSNQQGPTNQTLSGAVVKASNTGSDVGLLLISEAPPAEYNVYFAGWNRTNVPATSVTGIHHPSGDIKKISHATNSVSSSTMSGAQTWLIGTWTTGVTEPGSSGSPLFDQDHHIIGQLYGGNSSCGAPTSSLNDHYGKFYTSWSNGTTANKRLKDWLDPQNTGDSIIPGFDPSMVVPAFALDAELTSIVSPNVPFSCIDSINPVVKFINRGADTLTSVVINYGLNGSYNKTYTWTGSLNTGATKSVTLPVINNIADGSYTLDIVVVSANGSTDENIINDSISTNYSKVTGQEVVFSLKTDKWGDETTWEIKDGNGVVITSGGPYQSSSAPVQQAPVKVCLPPGCYDLVINDSYGDGICCQEGAGSYTLSDSSTVYATGGQFTFVKTHNFCIISTGIESTENKGFAIYPNPSTGIFNLKGVSSGDLVEVFNMMGQKIEVARTGSQLRVNSKGLFMVRVTSGNDTRTGVIIVE